MAAAVVFLIDYPIFSVITINFITLGAIMIDGIAKPQVSMF